MEYKAFKIRLEPNNKQKTMFLKHAGVSRHAYNQGLAYCNDLFEKTKKIPSAFDLQKWGVSFIKNEYPWYYEVSSKTSEKAFADVYDAFKNFYRQQKKSNYTLKDKKGRLKDLPNFKKKGTKDKFYLAGSIKIVGNKIQLPRIGFVKISEKKEPQKIKNCVVSRVADQWFVSFKIEFEPEKTIKKEDIVGVDLGVKTLATLSNGETFLNHKPYNKAKKKLRKQQKEVSRRFKKGAENQSKNYKKSVIKLSKIHARVANVRKHILHNVTSHLAKNFETVVIENLNVKNMVKNRNLASAILDGGFFEFKRQLLYKKQWYGGSVIIANSFYPSTKLCSCCGNKKDVIKLSERVYKCESCNTVLDRDLNASFNLKNLAVNSTVTALGDKSSASNEVQLVDELGIKHQMFTFE